MPLLFEKRAVMTLRGALPVQSTHKQCQSELENGFWRDLDAKLTETWMKIKKTALHCILMR